jgi:DNA processing protein
LALRADGFSEPDDWLATSAKLSAPLPQAPLTHESRIACLRLIRTDGIGPVTFRELINRFGGAEEALEGLPGLIKETGRKRGLQIASRDIAERELGAAEKLGLELIFTIEPGYPPLLAHIPPAPPPLIYIKGKRDILTRPAIAIVGSRDSSAAGQRLAREFARALNEAGYTIVSGLARGIDKVAHETTLARGTIAVLAGGLGSIYPPEHADLARAITETGCLISESPPDFEPRGQDFPRRNRIISGIARAVVIVEAAIRSGTLTTARYANEQGREVFAIPGHPLDPRAEGVNNLIKQGATFTTSPTDILATLGTFDVPLPVRASEPEERAPSPAQRPKSVQLPPALPPATLDAAAEAVWTALSPQPTTMDELIRATGLSARTVTTAITELALMNRIERHGQGLVSRREGHKE